MSLRINMAEVSESLRKLQDKYEVGVASLVTTPFPAPHEGGQPKVELVSHAYIDEDAFLTGWKITGIDDHKDDLWSVQFCDSDPPQFRHREPHGEWQDAIQISNLLPAIAFGEDFIAALIFSEAVHVIGHTLKSKAITDDESVPHLSRGFLSWRVAKDDGVARSED